MLSNSKKATQVTRTQPREHHYVFAHYTVRETCALDPLYFFFAVASPERERFVAWLWQMTEKRVGRPIADLDPTQLSITTCRVADLPAVILKMPSPVAAAEAHLMAVLLTEPNKVAGSESKPAFRYFTLEHGQNQDGTPRTVLCEWDEGAHKNFGDGPPPTVEAFAQVLEANL